MKTSQALLKYQIKISHQKTIDFSYKLYLNFTVELRPIKQSSLLYSTKKNS